MKVVLFSGYFRLLRMVGQVVGREAGKDEVITISAQLGLGLGLSLAISSKVEFLVVIVGGVAGFGLNILSLLVF